MPRYGNSSKAKLATTDQRLQDVMNEVIRDFDCSIIYGERTAEEQFELYKRGREERNGKWVITNPLQKVTNCDGTNKVSNHNYKPSRAIDAAPYPIDWRDTDRMYYFAGFVMATAVRLGVNLTWGGDWDRDTEVDDQSFDDLVHFEVVD